MSPFFIIDIIMKTFKKTMAKNSSRATDSYEHFEPLKALENLNHPLIPKLISYDNNTYECEFIEGLDFFKYIEKTRNVKSGITLVKTINQFMYSLLELQNTFKLQLFPDDISCVNIIVTPEGNPYIIDLDQFGFFDTYQILKIFKETNMRLYDSFILALSAGTINDQNNHIKNLENKLLNLM